jgi:spoIIIJ-associated protein
MKSIKFEAKTYDEAFAIAEEKLGASREFIRLEEDKRLEDKTIVFNAVLEVSTRELGYTVLRNVFKEMKLQATIEVTTTEEKQVMFSIESDENPILIGRNGRTLEALEYYLRTIVNQYTDTFQHVIVDVGSYKKTRKRQLEILATKTAKKVIDSKIEAVLDPLNAYERRIVHSKLSEWRDVVTESRGDGPERRLVIKPAS